MEIPLVAQRLARNGRYQAVICLGAVIRGSTPHFDHVASGVAHGVARVGLESGVPVIFGVLTTDETWTCVATEMIATAWRSECPRTPTR